MSSRDDSFLYDMLLEARRTGRFIRGLDRAELDEDETRRYALLHAITLFGEAAYDVSGTCLLCYPLSSGSSRPWGPWMTRGRRKAPLMGGERTLISGV